MEPDYGVQAPKDYKEPVWSNENMVHNWRNYISPELQRIWCSFSDEQKAIISSNAAGIADREHWD